eukprot:scpid52803/ scgid23424/ 
MRCLQLLALVVSLSGVVLSRPESSRSFSAGKDDVLANMNGLYLISNPNPASTVKYSTDYSKRENVSYFDVYTPPIVTRYGEVFWTMMDPVELDAELVAKFKGKTMAIVGYEADQVRKTDGGEESMPIFWQYNHHYIAHMTGAKSTVKEVDEETFRASGANGAYNHERFWMAVDVENDEVAAAPANIPTAQMFSEGNGGEYRKSYHGYPRGYAQLIYSPDTFHISPMQIDTHNRDHNKSSFVAGPLPKNSAAPANAEYSGLLECPCTDRIQKKIVTNYATVQKGVCQTFVLNASECFAAAATLKVPSSAAQKVVSDPNLPTGCSVVQSKENATEVMVVFNTNQQGQQCGGGTLFSGSGSAISNVSLSLALNATSPGLATISMTGPDGVWFGVGFNAVAMEDLPYAIIVNGSGGVMERKLANHDPGNQLADSVTVVSNAVVNGVRTVVMTRPLAGASKDHFTFNPFTLPTMPFISAVGNTSAFAYHRFKGSSKLAVTAENGASCICNAGTSGSINGIGFRKNCRDEPYGDLVQQKNPTCWVQTYQGGLHCCHHQWILLDQAQNPWINITDEYYLKFRFWYQEYNENGPSHTDLPRAYYQTEAYATEYDIPKKQDSVPADAAVHQITAHFQVKDMIRPTAGAKGVELIYAGGHCHAPSCLSMELYNADTGLLLCRHLPVYGEGSPENKFDEKGYLLLPPCLWGLEEDGLEPPVLLPFDGNMTSIKHNNNTYAHYGDMASWQMRAAYVF